MRKQRWLLFPVSFAWLVSAGWWFSRPEVCDRCQGKPMVASAEKVATPVTVVPHLHSIAQQPTTEVIAEVPSVVVKAPPPIILRFKKNTGEAQLQDELNDFAQQASAYLATALNAEVVVTGHTDADGPAATNEALSLARANKVRDSLVELGIPASRVRTVGAGALEPVADNVTSRGKALNRRVEIKIVPVIHSNTR